MRKLFTLLLLFLNMALYCQEDFETQIETAKSDRKSNQKKTKELKKKLSKLNNKVSTDFIDSTQTIIYDFKLKEYTKSMVIPRVREPLIFKIKNINRLAYEIKIKSDDVAIADEYFNPKIDEAVKSTEETINKKEGIAKKNQQDLNFNDTSFKTDQNNTTRLNELLKTTTELKEKIKQQELQLVNNDKELESLNIKLVGVAESNVDDRKKITDPIENLAKSNRDLTLEINTKKTQLETANNELGRLSQAFLEFKNKYDNLMESYSKLVSNGNALIKIENKYFEFRGIILNPLLDLESYTKKREDPDLILYKIEDSKNKVLTFEGQLNDFYNQYNIAIYDWEFFDMLNPDARENIRSRYQLIKEEIDKIKKEVDTENLKNLLIKVSSIDEILKQDKAYEMVSSPIQPLEDYVTFDIKIKHRDDKKQSEYDDNREFTYMEYTTGGVRFDFSTGVVFNFGGNNDKYELQDITVEGGATRKKIAITDDNEFTPSLAGMFHTSFRTSSILAFGFTLGASINVETFELNSLFPGVSLLLGKKQKFIFSAGPAFRKVDVLKKVYEQGKDYDPSLFNEQTQLTSSQFRVGIFVGITYNLTQKQRAKFKIGSN